MIDARRRLISVGAVAVLALSACGGSGTPGGGTAATGGAPDPTSSGAAHNPSDVPGGTLRFANSGDWDSLDPADTYYTYAWNFARLYGRTLTTFASAPGQQGATLVPDLAESLGRPGPDARSWTYTLRPGVTFEDGTPVTSRDVKYAVERSLDKNTFPNGSTYFDDLLDTRGYTGPYTDPRPDEPGLTAIETPDDRTIVFRLNRPFSGFDYLAQLPATIPVPVGKDTGGTYKQHVVSTGPYMFETVEPGVRYTLVRNPHWDRATDPNRKALPDRIEVALNVDSDDLDNRLVSGDLDVAVEGSGVGPAAQSRVLADPALQARAVSTRPARMLFTMLSASVPPLDNLDCRKAVLWAADRTGYQRAYGGPAGGDIATNLLPPVVPGAQQFDLYPSPGGTGDPERARAALAACGRPDGFGVKIAYRAERPRERATAEALQASLGRVGIRLELQAYPSSDYFELYAGNPAFVRANDLGLMVYGWTCDWGDGYACLGQLVDSRVIRAAGNTNLGIVDPAIDALIDRALQTTDRSARDQVWVDVDRKVMEDAFVLPGLWGRGIILGSPYLTNAFATDGYQMLDYSALGTTRR